MIWRVRRWPSRVMLADPSLPHQLTLAVESGTGRILVSCNCRRGGPPLLARMRFEDWREIRHAYECHLAGVARTGERL